MEHIPGHTGKKVIGNSQHRLTKGKSYLTDLIASYAKMARTLGKRDQWMSFTLTLARLSALSATVFLYSSWDVIVWRGAKLGG